MNIYILNASNTYNYGSMMMAENFIHYFDQISGMKNTYHVETEDPENTLARLKAATGAEQLRCPLPGSLYQGGQASKKDLLAALFLRKDIVSGFAGEIDALIILGGDDYTEDYGWRTLVSQLIRLNALKRKLKTYLIGQTMGPFYSFRKPLARFFLRKADGILARDRITYEYLTGMGLPNVGEIPDLALMPLAMEPETVGPETSAVEKRICLFPSELIFKYSRGQSREQCLGFYLGICRSLLGKYTDHKILLIPHVLKPPSSDDRAMVRDLYAALSPEERTKVEILDREMLPVEVRILIKSSRLVVSARMHPVVSALECRVPWICFSYSRKYWGILGEGFKLGDYILDVRNGSFDELSHRFGELLEKVEAHRDSILRQIEGKVREEQQRIRDVILSMAGKIIKK